MSVLILPKRRVTQIGIFSQFDINNCDYSEVINENLKNGWRIQGDFIVTPNGLTAVMAHEVEIEATF